jgi:RHS repeat-associated protein
MATRWDTITYTYDFAGRRIAKAYDGTTVTKYLYDGGQILAEYDGSNNLLHKYIHGPGVDQPICMIDVNDANATYYYHFDGLGSVVALSDDSGDTVQVYEYSVFGQAAASDPNHPNRFLFTGREFDSETGLYYYRARYYNPHIGRFLQTDPANQGMNPYQYCRNNSVNCVDPSGLWTVAFYWGQDAANWSGAQALEAANDATYFYDMSTCPEGMTLIEWLGAIFQDLQAKTGSEWTDLKNVRFYDRPCVDGDGERTLYMGNETFSVASDAFYGFMSALGDMLPYIEETRFEETGLWPGTYIARTYRIPTATSIDFRQDGLISPGNAPWNTLDVLSMMSSRSNRVVTALQTGLIWPGESGDYTWGRWWSDPTEDGDAPDYYYRSSYEYGPAIIGCDRRGELRWENGSWVPWTLIGTGLNMGLENGVGFGFGRGRDPYDSPGKKWAY